MPPEAVRSTDPPEQNVVGPFGVMAATGSGLTVTVLLAVLLQPFAPVTVTLYVPLEETVIMAVVDAFDHRYPVPPEAVRSTDPPEQKVVGPFGVITATGSGLTVTVVLAVLLQPLTSVTVTL